MSRIHLALVSVLSAPLLVSACGFRSDLDPTPLGGITVAQQDSAQAKDSTTIVQPDGNTVIPDSTVAPADSTVAPSDSSVTPVDSAVIVTPDATIAPDSSSPADAAVPFDGAMPNGVQCTDTLTCAVGETCCITATGESCAASCPTTEPVFAIGCDGTEDCASTGNVCCVGVDFAGGTFPACNIAGGNTTCKSSAACGYNLPFSCGTSFRSQLCETSTDCGSAAPRCCDITALGLGVRGRFCTDTTIAGFLGGACN